MNNDRTNSILTLFSLASIMTILVSAAHLTSLNYESDPLVNTRVFIMHVVNVISWIIWIRLAHESEAFYGKDLFGSKKKQIMGFVYTLCAAVLAITSFILSIRKLTH